VQNELPGMPAPEAPRKGSFAHTRRELRRFLELSKKHQGLTQVCVAAIAIGVSRQRAYQLVNDGRIQSFDIFGKVYLPCDEVEAFAVLERPAGRPWPSTVVAA
jgi:hypothetical protein